MIAKIKRHWLVCVNNCKHSKINFLFQTINFSLLLLFFWCILPRYMNISILGTSFDGNIGTLFGGFVGQFILWTISLFLPFKRIFETTFIITIMLSCLFIFIFLFTSLSVKQFKIIVQEFSFKFSKKDF